MHSAVHQTGDKLICHPLSNIDESGATPIIKSCYRYLKARQRNGTTTTDDNSKCLVGSVVCLAQFADLIERLIGFHHDCMSAYLCRPTCCSKLRTTSIKAKWNGRIVDVHSIHAKANVESPTSINVPHILYLGSDRHFLTSGRADRAQRDICNDQI